MRIGSQEGRDYSVYRTKIGAKLDDLRTAISRSLGPFEQAKAYVNLGLELSRDGRNLEAIVFFDNALDIEHENLNALFGKAISLRAINKFELALADIDRILALLSLRFQTERLHAEKFHALKQKITLLIKLNRIDMAFDLYQGIVSHPTTTNEHCISKKDWSALREIIKDGLMASGMPLIPLAYDSFIYRLFGFPKVDQLIRKGEQYYKLGSYLKALFLYKEALELNPRDARALEKMRVVSVKLGLSTELMNVLPAFSSGLLGIEMTARVG